MFQEKLQYWPDSQEDILKKHWNTFRQVRGNAMK